MDNKFSAEDKKNIIDFLNLTSKNAKFTVDIPEMIQYHSLLTYMQKVLLPKVEANILEVIAVHEEAKPKKAAKKK